MRNISFALTTNQIRAGTKTVTRRMGWLKLAPGTLLQPVKKGMGLKPGEKIERLRGPIRVIGVRREPLSDITPDDCAREGFPDYSPASFIDMFCRSHTDCEPGSVVTRIEFEYV